MSNSPIITTQAAKALENYFLTFSEEEMDSNFIEAICLIIESENFAQKPSQDRGTMIFYMLHLKRLMHLMHRSDDESLANELKTN